MAYKRLPSELSTNGSLERTLEKNARRLKTRVWFSMQAHLLVGGKDGDTVYRLEWMEAHVRTISARLQVAQGAKLSFEEQCGMFFDTKVDPEYFDPNRTDIVARKLEKAFPHPSDKPLHRRVDAYLESCLIAKEQYEPVFRRIVNDVMCLMQQRVPELLTASVRQKYVDDMTQCFEATCEPRADGVSEMLVNVARPITWAKAQQLSTHELTHHMQFVLMHQYLYPLCPELRVCLDDGPMGMLLEGGAEVAVDLFLPPADRQDDLVRRVPDHLKMLVSKIDKSGIPSCQKRHACCIRCPVCWRWSDSRGTDSGP